MMPTSQKEINRREKDLYYTVLGFLKKIRKAGKTTAKEWNEYRSAIKSVALTADMGKAADLWTMDNLDQFSPDKSQLPPLNDMEYVARVSPESLEELLVKLWIGNAKSYRKTIMN